MFDWVVSLKEPVAQADSVAVVLVQVEAAKQAAAAYAIENPQLEEVRAGRREGGREKGGREAAGGRTHHELEVVAGALGRA